MPSSGAYILRIFKIELRLIGLRFRHQLVRLALCYQVSRCILDLSWKVTAFCLLGPGRFGLRLAALRA